MAERSQNLQDQFLNTVRKTKNPLTIFLVNGVKLTGVVTSFDNFCVLLRRVNAQQRQHCHGGREQRQSIRDGQLRQQNREGGDGKKTGIGIKNGKPA